MEGPRVLVLGGAGLIGHAVSLHLLAHGMAVTAVARRFTPAQAVALGEAACTLPVVDVDGEELAALLRETAPEVVVNCLGALQDGPRGTVEDVHAGFVDRLLAAMAWRGGDAVLVHVSMPGYPADDATPFSRTKRRAEDAIAASTVPSVVLRPGFVVAPAAFGGGAMVRALAALPFSLPRNLAARPFATCPMADVSRTVADVAVRRYCGETSWKETWDIVEPSPPTVGEVVEAFRRHYGGPRPRARLPLALLRLSAMAGDAVSRLGWSPPVRTTALAEMARGVAGDPTTWTKATGFNPTGLRASLAAAPATVQERWFARMFLLKPAVLGCLAAFWVVSGLVALFPSFGAAKGILTGLGIPDGPAGALTVATALADVLIGVMLAFRRTAATGLRAGIALSLGYLAASAVLAPAMWLDPVGSMVKTVPTVILMLVAQAILDER